ncbi:hypothetical protein [Alteribacillus bidgolensis]|uniref:Uncharacterized protein n=1 Tax=Alteribacillus bidgolensis TaxID=930129 RepID=A0A1G8LZA9_9BACI|nr:hypothetical protein [Alteribacillus bidgolensis]SDI60985.1 hypothetical protein SAMN05216352_109143 [Alteribacillus bidgolensis]
MSNSKGNKAGYVKGLGRTFAPSLKADWVDEFNQILEEEPDWSRNRLTEHLIKKGLESQRAQQSQLENHLNLSIPSDGLNKEQQSFLESEEGKVFVGNAIRLLLMQPGSRESAASSVHLPAPPQPKTETSSSFEEQEKKSPEETMDDKNRQDAENFNLKEKNKQKQEKLSPLKRAKNKLKRQNIN